MKLRIASDDRDHAILVCDEDSNDIAEFYHSDHATVGQSYETAIALAKLLVALSGPVAFITKAALARFQNGQDPENHILLRDGNDLRVALYAAPQPPAAVSTEKGTASE